MNKKKIVSVLLSVAMLCSTLGVPVFAKEPAETEIVSRAEETSEAEKVPKDYGSAVESGESRYEIADDGLQLTRDGESRVFDSGKITYVIEHDGVLYWSKLDGNNSQVYRQNLSGGEKTVLAGVFVPVEAFDVSGDELYYLYNGEITKLNVMTDEETSLGMFDCDGFYVDNEKIICCNKKAVIDDASKLSTEQYDEVVLLSNDDYNSYRAKVDALNSMDVPLQPQRYRVYDTTTNNGTGICNVVAATQLLNRRLAYDLGSNYNRNNSFSLTDVITQCGNTVSASEIANSYRKGNTGYIYSGNGTGSWFVNTFTSSNGSSYKITKISKYEVKTNDFSEYLANILLDHPEGIHYRGGNHCIVITDFVRNSNGSISFYAIDGVNVKNNPSQGRIALNRTWQCTGNGVSNLYNSMDYIAYINTSNSTINYNNNTINKPIINHRIDKNVYINITSCPTDGFVPGKFTLRGNIKSAYAIKKVSGVLRNSDTGREVSRSGNIYVNTKNYKLDNSKIDCSIRFDWIREPGTYEVIISAENAVGEKETETKKFTVAGTEMQRPSISATTITYGQKITVESSDRAAQVHYTVNGGNERHATWSLTEGFTEAGTYNIAAWVTKSGYHDSPMEYYTVNVGKAATPQISEPVYEENRAKVTLSGEGTIYYTTNGSSPTESSSQYTGPIYLTENTVIKAFAVKYGCESSDNAQKQITLSAPSAPKVTLFNTKEKIAQKKTAAFNWDKVSNATSYTATLYHNGSAVKTYSTTGTTASFVLDKTGVYTLKVAAKNFKGSSPESMGVSVESMAPVTVTFVDRIERTNDITDATVAEIQQRIYDHNGADAEKVEGNIVSKQVIDYDTKPVKPVTPSKKGFTFAGYGDGLYKEATENKTIYVNYEINYYNVDFYDTSTDTPTQLGYTQEIMYSGSAAAPENYNTPAGYIMSGWSVDNTQSDCYDYKFVEGDMRLYTAYSWENEELPVFIQITDLVRNDKSYKLKLRIKNNPVDEVQARIVVALYTTDGRNVYTQLSENDLEIGTQNDWTDYPEITLLYTGKIAYAKAFAVAVDGDKTGGALSKAATFDKVTYAEGSNFWTDWSDWSETPVASDSYTKVETKTQYSYQDKSTTTSNSKTLSGWTLYNTTSSVGGWSGWSSSYVGGFSNDAQRREVQTRWITNYKTQYHYYHYCGTSAPWVSYGSSHPYYYDRWVDYELPWLRYSGGRDQYGDGTKCDRWGNGCQYWLKDTNNWTRTVENGGYTEYSYRDTYYTYYFYKWGNWSSWSDSYVAASSNRNVKTRTLYRYKTSSAVDSEKEESTVFTYNMSGKLDKIEDNLAGELATVMIYKKTNSDPTQEQIEYIDQITIGEGNAYTISANTKEVPHYTNTGDFIVTIALEGGKKLFNVDYIEAPRPDCTVNFYLDNGELYKSVVVQQGESVDVNEVGIPSVQGKRFVKWDKSVVNINKNLSVNAVFEPETVHVVFVDCENKTAEMHEYTYGEAIVVPQPEKVEGKTFEGWEGISEDKDNIATDSKVIMASWSNNTYTVNFCDFDNNIVSEQTVAYGHAAEMPDFVEKDGIAYMWDLTGSEWWNVTGDMTIYPYVPQSVIVDMPVISAETTEVYGTFYAQLKTSDSSNKIYYSIDGFISEEIARTFIDGLEMTDYNSNNLNALETTEKQDESELVADAIELKNFIEEYTGEEIEITAGNTVYAFAADQDGNISPIAVFDYEQTWNEADLGEAPDEYVPDETAQQILIPTIVASAGETVTLPVEIKNNPGLNKLSFTLNFDNSLKLDEFKNGNVFANGEFNGEMNGDGSYTFSWNPSSTNSTDGTLMELTFTLADNAEKGKYIIDFSDFYASDETDTETYLIARAGSINSSIILGDVFKDGEINSKDGLRLSQHLAGWKVELTNDEKSAADVFPDGEVNSKDGLKLSQYLAGWNVSLMAADEDSINLMSQGKIAFKVENAVGKAGGYVDITVTITENSGVAAFNLEMSYDSEKMTPVSITKNLSDGELTSNIQQSEFKGNTVTAYWVNPANVDATGTAFTVKFKINETATGEIPISLNYKSGNICDQDYNDLEVGIVNGNLTVNGQVQPKDYTVSALSVETEENGESYAEVTVTKNTGRDAEDSIIIAVYDENRNLIDKNVTKQSFVKGKDTVLRKKIVWHEGCTIKAFVWSGLKDMQPISNVIAK